MKTGRIEPRGKGRFDAVLCIDTDKRAGGVVVRGELELKRRRVATIEEGRQWLLAERALVKEYNPHRTVASSLRHDRQVGKSPRKRFHRWSFL